MGYRCRGWYLSTVKSDACEARAEYLAYVAHELRNPLSTALWCVEMIALDRGGERAEKLAQTARRAILRLSRLVEDHVLLERLATGGLELRVENLALGEALGEPAAKGAGAAGADVEAPEGLTVRGDRALLQRALEALVAAAARGGTRVRVQAAPAPGGAVVTIRGSPVEPGELELPRRGSPSDPTGGSLGLVVAGAVAASLGGSLSAVDGALVLTCPGSTP